jgi:type 1 fimbria pilin
LKKFGTLSALLKKHNQLYGFNMKDNIRDLNMKNKIFLTAAASLLALSLSTGASAALITGTLAYSTLTSGSAWSFDHAANTITVGDGQVDFVSGDLASTIALGDTVVALPTFTYDVFLPSVNIWDLGDFSFDLDSVDSYTENPGNLYLTGSGTVSKAGFEDTNMAWTISGNSLTFAAITVPEPSVIALFGLGLLGLGLARRKIRS